jgi:hypothetical protein
MFGLDNAIDNSINKMPKITVTISALNFATPIVISDVW